MKFIYPVILISLLGVSSCNKGSDFFEKEFTSIGQWDDKASESPHLPKPAEEEVPETPVIPAAEEEAPEAPVIPAEEEEVPEAPVIPAEEEVVPESPVIPAAEEEEVPEAPVAPAEEEEAVAVEEPVADESSCRYIVRTNTGGQNIKLTVISAPRHKLDLSAYAEFQALSALNQDFVSRSVDDSHSSITTVASKSTNQQKASETLKISSSDAKASMTTIHSGVTLQYFFDAPVAKFSTNQLNAGSRVLIVMNSSDSGEVSFTGIGDGSEVFVVFLAQGHNATCVQATGTEGEVASYVVSDSDQSAYSKVSATEFASGSIVNQSIIADRDAVSELRSTSLSSSNVNISSEAGGKSISSLQATSGDERNQINVVQRAEEHASYSMQATSVGLNTRVLLDIVSQTKASAKFKFTDHSNIEIAGKLQAPATELDLDSRLQKSKTAKITVSH